MPRDFKTFSEKSKNESTMHSNNTSNYQDIIDKYKDMDRDSLMSNLFSEATKLKREGKLNSETLNNLKTSLSPFLNTEQQNMLNSLISAINEQ